MTPVTLEATAASILHFKAFSGVVCDQHGVTTLSHALPKPNMPGMLLAAWYFCVPLTSCCQHLLMAAL